MSPRCGCPAASTTPPTPSPDVRRADRDLAVREPDVVLPCPRSPSRPRHAGVPTTAATTTTAASTAPPPCCVSHEGGRHARNRRRSHLRLAGTMPAVDLAIALGQALGLAIACGLVPLLPLAVGALAAAFAGTPGALGVYDDARRRGGLVRIGVHRRRRRRLAADHRTRSSWAPRAAARRPSSRAGTRCRTPVSPSARCSARRAPGSSARLVDRAMERRGHARRHRRHRRPAPASSPPARADPVRRLPARARRSPGSAAAAAAATRSKYAGLRACADRPHGRGEEARAGRRRRPRGAAPRPRLAEGPRADHRGAHRAGRPARAGRRRASRR